MLISLHRLEACATIYGRSACAAVVPLRRDEGVRSTATYQFVVGCFRLSQESGYYITKYIGQAEVAAAVAIGQLFVV